MLEERGRGEWEQREGVEQYRSQGLGTYFSHCTTPRSPVCIDLGEKMSNDALGACPCLGRNGLLFLLNLLCI